jgi:D-lactate dehydrogenase (cytochrome)
VPISRLAECIVETKRDIAESRLVAPLVSHAGDGNFHTVVMVMMDDADEVSRATAFLDRLAGRAIAMEGTCTGEHGIGEGKKRFLGRSMAASRWRCARSRRWIRRIRIPEDLLRPASIPQDDGQSKVRDRGRS